LTIGIIGAELIGAAFARRLAKANLPAILSNSRGPDSLADPVADIGGSIRAGTREERAAPNLVLVAVNWSKLPGGRALLAAGILSLALIWAQVGIAQSGSHFVKFAGSWRGSGQIVGTSGSHERISCLARYAIDQNGGALSQSLVCASDSYRVDINSYLVADGASVLGHWQETTRQVQGDISGKIADGNFEGRVAGIGFSAGISLRANGRKQFISIKPSGGDIADVNIVLTRRN
jgi:hypothetical protein